MRLTWLTDIHLNFLSRFETLDFLRFVKTLDADAVLISGDIAEAYDLIGYLELIDEEFACPVYFVLGNHDFYHGAIAEVCERVASVCERRPQLHYLSQIQAPIELTPTIGLVGHDGWADGRIGSYERSLVRMNDWQLIAELAGRSKRDRWQVLQALGDEAANHLRRVLHVALDRFAHVYVVTHVPPLREACWHQGAISDDHWAPHFTCKAVGDVLLECAAAHPNRQITVLCGHTHGAGECQPLPNLKILTGGADYGTPIIQRVLEL